jgi:thiamine kinase-like enzyme
MLDKCIARARNAEIYSWGTDLVLKLFYDFIPVEKVDGEFSKTLIIREKTQICPEIHDRVSLEEGEGIVYENIQGKSITYNLLNNPIRVREYAAIMAQTHRSIHKITVDELPKVTDEIDQKIGSSTMLEDEQKLKLSKILKYVSGDDKLCHMNFHPDSIFVGDKGQKVIDWMDSGKGNPLLDVAKTVILLRFSSSPFHNALFRGVVKLSREILIKEYLDEYFQDKGYCEDEFKKCMLLVAAARINEKLPESEIGRLKNFIQEEL